MAEAAIFQGRRRRRADLAEQWVADMPAKTEIPWLRRWSEAAILEARGDVDGALANLEDVAAMIRAGSSRPSLKIPFANATGSPSGRTATMQNHVPSRFANAWRHCASRTATGGPFHHRCVRVVPRTDVQCGKPRDIGLESFTER
jgi:hypothetical protein